MSWPTVETGLHLSVVVAAQNARATIARSLTALEQQRADGVAEIIVVDNSSDGTGDLARERFPAVRVLERPGRALVPELWAAGIVAVQAPVVALTTAEMVPGPGWARALLAAHARRPLAAVGGPVLPGPNLATCDRAIYWLRYSGSAVSRAAGEVPDLHGDNASYRQEWLVPLRDRIVREGFWENEIHPLLRAREGGLFFTPEAVVRYEGGTRFGEFARQRVVHGRRFGDHRMAGLGGIRRLLLMAVWPLTPGVFLARICERAARAGSGASFVTALPALLALLACWSVGELQGYVSRVRG